jgi:DNA polymerase-3 subunit beta
MHFVIKKAAFLTALDKAAATVSSKDNDPLLKTFNIEADPDQVRILSTDLSLGSIAKIRGGVQVKDDGAICVPAQKLQAIVRSAEDGDIDFKLEENQVTVKAGRAKWQVNILDPEDYPEVPRFESESAKKVKREKLIDAIGKVQYAASTDEMRPYLMLIAFDGKRAMASDGSRLQIADFEGLEGVQIPIFAVNNLVRLLNRTEVEEVSVELKKNHLLFQIGADTFSSQRLYEEFPDVEEMILKPASGNDQKLTLDKTDLLAAIKRIALAADEERKQLNLQILEPTNGDKPKEVKVMAQDQHGELAVETLPCTTTATAGRTLMINHKFLADALEMSPAKQVTFKIGEDLPKRRSSIFMEEPGLKSVLLQLRPDD